MHHSVVLVFPLAHHAGHGGPIPWLAMRVGFGPTEMPIFWAIWASTMGWSVPWIASSLQVSPREQASLSARAGDGCAARSSAGPMEEMRGNWLKSIAFDQ